MTAPMWIIRRRTAQRKLAAVETLLRYAQPLPDGELFCRNVIRVAVADLTDDPGVWHRLRCQLPECEPGGSCC